MIGGFDYISKESIVMEQMIVKGTPINVQWKQNRDDYISLTDIAKIKDSDNPRYIIQNWMRNRNTIEFLGVCEKGRSNKLF